MKIAIVTQYYKPEAVPIPAQLAHGLVERGHDVHVVTGFPNYPAGELFPGYRQKFAHTEYDGKVHVRRVPLIVSHSTNVIGRVLNYMSFGLSSLTAGRFVRGADVVYVYATPMTAALAPQIWRFIRKTPLVLHVQDVWPESITGSGMIRDGVIGAVLARILNQWLRSLYGSAAAIIGIAPTMSQTLINRGAPSDRTHTVFNWGNEPSSESVDRPAQIPNRFATCTVTYAGNIGDLQDLETVIRAADRVRDLAGFRLVLHGDGVALNRLRELARVLKASNVEFKERIAPDRLELLYDESDFQVVSLKDLEIFKGTIPSKFQASLAFGVPVITTVRGDMAAMVEEQQLGFVAQPENVESLAATFRDAYALSGRARREMAQRARDFYVSSLSTTRGIDQIERILSAAARYGRGRVNGVDV